MHVVGIWKAKGSWVKITILFFSPLNRVQIFQEYCYENRELHAPLALRTTHNFWCFMWINKHHQICYLLEGTFWKGNMTLFSSGRQPKALDTRSAPQKLVLLWVPQLFRTSLLCVLHSTVAHPTMWRPPKKAREPVPVFLPSHWPPQLREHLA